MSWSSAVETLRPVWLRLVMIKRASAMIGVRIRSLIRALVRVERKNIPTYLLGPLPFLY